MSQREYILMCLVILSSLGPFHMKWLKPKHNELALTQTKITQLNLANKNTAAAIAAGAVRAPASTEIDQYIKSNDKFSSVVSGIINGTKNKSFSLTRINSEPSVKASGITQTQYSVEGEATFIAIGKFLESLEDSTLLTEIQSIDILRIENEMKRCKVTIRLKSYVMGAGV